MKKPALILEEDSNVQDKPVLIVDKIGIIGSALALKLSKDLLIVLVSEKASKEENSNIIHVPYCKKFPEIPDNTYSYIILFSDGVIDNSIDTFIKKAKEDNSALFFIAYFLDLVHKTESDLEEYKKTKIILYGDIFGEGEVLMLNNRINGFVKQVKKFRRIEVPGDGLEKVFPIQFGDLISGIIKGIFGVTSESKIFYLLPKYPMTLISLAHLIQKKDPNIHIDLKPNKAVRKEDPKLEEGEYLLLDSYSYQEKIKNLNLEEREIDYIQESSVKGQFYEEKENQIKKFLYPLFLIILFLLLPFLSTLFFSSLGFINLNSARASLEKGDLKSSQALILSSFNLFNLSELTLNVLTRQVNIIGKRNFIEPFLKKIETGKKISESASYATKSLDFLKRVSKGESVDPTEDMISSITLLKQSLISLKELEAQGDLPVQFVRTIGFYSNLITPVFNIQNTLPNIVDTKGKNKYLVLFQNNMELRPGGGFIGSYGILNLNKGKIEDFSIHDVYEADGQLKGHVEPPYPIRRYVPEVHWYLRNSNFDVDFTKSASLAAFFLYQETGQIVDGVIGIDVSFVKNLVSAVGPIYVPEYKETVNGDNFFIVTETHADKNSFPSSTQKKDFLTFLYKAINNKISSEKKLPYLSILKSIGDSILEKHILFAFSNSDLQKTFTVNGLSSSLWDDREIDSSVVNDFVGISEANIGVNKANYFIGRSVSYKTQLKDDGKFLSKLSLSFKNDSTKWPGGDYKNYIRFILPKGSVLDGVIIDGVSQKTVRAVTDPLIYEAKNFIPPDGLEVEKTEEGNKTIYGFLVIVPSGKLKKIEIEYTLPQKISSDTPFVSYNLKLFKQPGTESYSFDLMFSYPSVFRILTSSSGLKNQDQKAILQKQVSQDQEIRINLTQK